MSYPKSGQFVPSTFSTDVQQVSSVDVNSAEFKELLIRLYQDLNIMALATNERQSGSYSTLESFSGKSYFSNPAYTSLTANKAALRPVIRVVVFYNVALPNTAAVSIPHGITVTPTTTFVDYYGVANDPTAQTALKLPYASPTLVNNIEVSVDATNINVTTGSNRQSYTVNYFVVEYITN